MEILNRARDWLTERLGIGFGHASNAMTDVYSDMNNYLEETYGVKTTGPVALATYRDQGQVLTLGYLEYKSDDEIGLYPTKLGMTPVCQFETPAEALASIQAFKDEASRRGLQPVDSYDPPTISTGDGATPARP